MEKATILLVEDDPNLGFVIQDALSLEGYKVHLARNGNQGLKYFNDNPYDLCIFDVMMPEKDGFSLAEDVRKLNLEVPIVFLTAKSMTEDKITGFKAGGDDYITKPFSNEELLLRLEAILKRSGKQKDNPKDNNTYKIGTYIYDYANFKLLNKQGEVVKKLTKKEAEILKLLCTNTNQVVERELIASLVWGESNYFIGRSLDVFITKLRKYLNEDKNVNIENAHGIGFKLIC